MDFSNSHKSTADTELDPSSSLPSRDLEEWVEARAWPCPTSPQGSALGQETVVGGTSGAAAPWGWGKPEPGPGRASQGPGQGQLSRTVCPRRGQGGCHSEHTVCQSLGPGRLSLLAPSRARPRGCWGRHPGSEPPAAHSPPPATGD